MNALYSNRFASSTMSRLLPLWSLLALLGFAACDSSTGTGDEVPVREPGIASYQVIPSGDNGPDPFQVEGVAYFSELEGTDARGVDGTLFAVQADVEGENSATSVAFGFYGGQPDVGTYRIGKMVEVTEEFGADFPYDGAFGFMSIGVNSGEFELIASVEGTLTVEQSDDDVFQAHFEMEALYGVMSDSFGTMETTAQVMGSFNAVPNSVMSGATRPNLSAMEAMMQ